MIIDKDAMGLAEMHKYDATLEERQFAENLALFANQLVAIARDHVIEHASEYFANKALVNMLQLYADTLSNIADDAVVQILSELHRGPVCTSSYDTRTVANEYFKAIRALIVDGWWKATIKRPIQYATMWWPEC